MRFLITFLAIFYSCSCHAQETLHLPFSKDPFLDSIRSECKTARVSLHHQRQKKSLVVKDIYNEQGIDSLLGYIGKFDTSTQCLRGGLYNYFGQINVYKDSSRRVKIAEIHFVPNGNCAGFYLETAYYSRRYDMTAEGRIFIMKIYNSKINLLK